MKVSKVDKIRVAVGKSAPEKDSRGMLYRTGSKADEKNVKDIVGERVNQANNRYSAFFRSSFYQ